VKCWQAGNTHKTLARVCQGKSSVEYDVHMCLREIDGEGNSFDCPRKDTLFEKWYCPPLVLYMHGNSSLAEYTQRNLTFMGSCIVILFL